MHFLPFRKDSTQLHLNPWVNKIYIFIVCVLQYYIISDITFIYQQMVVVKCYFVNR